MEAKTERKEVPKGLEWGYEIPQARAQKIKENIPQIGGLNEETVLAGHVLERIINDDRGALGTAAMWFSAEIMDPSGALEHKTIFLNRLRWEEEQPQTPQKIKDAIAALKQKIEGKAWDKEENLKKATNLWERMVRSKAKAMVDANEEGAGEALEHYYLYTDEVVKRGLSL
jgi:hypothetical protein